MQHWAPNLRTGAETRTPPERIPDRVRSPTPAGQTSCFADATKWSATSHNGLPESLAAHIRGLRAFTSNCSDSARYRREAGRVEDWRGVPKVEPSLLLPVSSGSASIAKPWIRFQPPPHRTQRADFPHWAHLFVWCQELWGYRAGGDCPAWPSTQLV